VLQAGKVRLLFNLIWRLIAVADSTVLAYVMKTLNERYNYGLDLFLLSIDEGITGYRDDSLEVRYQVRYTSGSCVLIKPHADS
jgi:hypothetical protein